MSADCSGQQQTQLHEKPGGQEAHTPLHSPSLGAGENPEVLSRTRGPAGSRPLAWALASSMARLLFSTSLSRCVRSTYGVKIRNNSEPAASNKIQMCTLHENNTEPFSECKAAGFSGRSLEFLLQLLQTEGTSGDGWAVGSVNTNTL